MSSNQNNFYSFEEKNKIRNTNLYRVLQDIEKEYSAVNDINNINNVEDYIPYHIVGLQKKKYLPIDGLTELFRRMSKQTRTECCPLMIESSSTIYIDLDYSNQYQPKMIHLQALFHYHHI